MFPVGTSRHVDESIRCFRAVTRLNAMRAALSFGPVIGLEWAATMIISGDDPVSKDAQRFEVFTGAGKRREWLPEAKASIVATYYSGREGVSAVARRHGLGPSQVYAWPRDLRTLFKAAELIASPTEPGSAVACPAVAAPGLTAAPASKRRTRRRHRPTRVAVELEIDDVAVDIRRCADAGTITTATC